MCFRNENVLRHVHSVFTLPLSNSPTCSQGQGWENSRDGTSVRHENVAAGVETPDQSVFKYFHKEQKEISFIHRSEEF